LPPSGQRLIAFLALQKRPVMRAFVASSLWLDQPDERASASLRSALWQQRRNGLDLVTVSRDQLELSRHLDVDLWNTVTQARQLLKRGAADESECVDVADRLGALPGGELLPDWYDEWVVAERERVRQLRLHALEMVGHLLISRRRLIEAIEAGLAAVASDPLRESAHRVVIAAHLAEGNNSEALRQYEAFTQLLDEHLGIAPSAQLAELIAPVLPDRNRLAYRMTRRVDPAGSRTRGQLVSSGAARM
jgi:DNA-binding SARP family transcriptional activator